MLQTFSKLEKTVLVAMVSAAVVVAYLLVSAPEADLDWEDFKATHHCQSVGVESGNNRAGWRCDDGKVYYRWRQQK